MEKLVNQKIVITGHTGFKGSWLSLILAKNNSLFGYALQPANQSGIYVQANISKLFDDEIFGDILDYLKLENFIEKTKPDHVIHLAAQPIVSEGYRNPLKTFSINGTGVANLLDICKKFPNIKSIAIVTSDKVYEPNYNRYLLETDKLGGVDPYSASKTLQEIITKSYFESFFKESATKIVTLRSGNVIGGGDWSQDRLFPDIERSINTGSILSIRNMNSVRPWQHVLEPINGYILAIESLNSSNEDRFQTYNFGPSDNQHLTVGELLNYSAKILKKQMPQITYIEGIYAESTQLTLDSSKALTFLNWKNVFSAEEAVKLTHDWYACWRDKGNIEEFTAQQISEYYDRLSRA